ncbi:regulatory protein RecX [Leptolyngbya sp. 7M]|uniref:regulatory protein RecX n=1 Tax=Leptolyngbya sp. 7M TaxID=2812896 RepID=UPI001B8B652D|nr:regulatory protein RecX [Leptolyngbya sp. 7M]QYO65473.1 recombination regulator RecX [Leptolyngbya sp. 7M]
MRRWQKATINDGQTIINNVQRSRERTMNRAIKLLAAKPRSIAELKERLLEKLWTNEEIVGAVIEQLKEYKYLDDDQFVCDLAISKLKRKPQGRRKLLHSLSKKKIDRDKVEGAILKAFKEFPEESLIDLVIEKRLRTTGVPQTSEDTKKLFDHLLRQGFDLDLIRSRLSDLTGRTKA